MSRCVVDSSVVLAFLLQEPGQERAAELVQDCIISSVNLAEIVTKLTANNFSEVEIAEDLTHLNLVIIPFDQPQAVTTGLLRISTRHKGLSLGDRACLALALREKLPVYSTDKSWGDLDIGVDIRQLR